MCRVYKDKNGNYVRLCYRFGPRRGERVYFVGDPPLGPSGHYAGPREGSVPRERKFRERRRCAVCGSPVVSRHDSVCSLCKEFERRGEGR